MGSASSRIVRRAVKPITSQPREPSSLSLDSTACNSHPIERDDQNAHFIANIRRLGPVSVDHHATRYAPISPHSRQTAFESPNASTKQSVMPVHRVHELLDRRKNATSPSSLASLVQNHGMDLGLLDQLVGVVNSPSVRAGAGVQFIHTDTGEQTLSMTALWVNPRLDAS
ncbi:hypothetical protein AX14_008843 [Amanita brunnescens Koide BX004]|nr:hypothetical protein AX14_008843 [Amanita brunnescens Koide BX004]